MRRIKLWLSRRAAVRNMNRFKKTLDTWMSGKIPKYMDSQDVLECYTIYLLFQNGTPVITYNLKLPLILPMYGFKLIPRSNGIGWNVVA